MAPLRVGRGGGIGLDVGTSAVRAAEIRAGSPPVMVRLGQVPLPHGAVVDGEVEDPDAVARALTTLWKRVEFRSRRVRVGISNQKVIVRQIEFPAMPRDELASAIPYQAQDQIPIPLADAVLDFDIVDELAGPEGEALQRVLVVAAQRAMVDSLLDALRLAKLRPDVLELNAYPLTRALGSTSPLQAGSDAIVDVGAGVTNVVVQQTGRVRFVRPLNTGGDDFTSVLVQTFNIDWDEAETLKHRCSPRLAVRLGVTDAPGADDVDDDAEADHAVEAMVPRVQRFVEEIRSSLDYYTGLPDSVPLDRLVLTGGGTLLGGLTERLSAALRMDTELGRPLQRLQVGKVKLDDEQLQAAEPFLAVAIGLGLGGLEH